MPTLNMVVVLSIIFDHSVLSGHYASILSEPVLLANTFAQKLSAPFSLNSDVNLGKDG
jgi:hypothetical protein